MPSLTFITFSLWKLKLGRKIELPVLNLKSYDRAGGLGPSYASYRTYERDFFFFF